MRTRLFALNDDAPALKDNLMAPPFLRRLPLTKTTFVTTRRTASRVNVATHSTYSETLLVDGVPANTTVMSPHPQQPQKRQIEGLCDGNGSDGKVVLRRDQEGGRWPGLCAREMTTRSKKASGPSNSRSTFSAGAFGLSSSSSRSRW